MTDVHDGAHTRTSAVGPADDNDPGNEPGADSDVRDVAAALRVNLGLLVRRLRQVPAAGELTVPETSALARLDRQGPATSSALAKQDQISPQSMGATLSALEARGLIERHPDARDGRRILLSLTEAGQRVLRDKRDARTGLIAQALADGFTAAEISQLEAVMPLFERLAQSI